MNQVPITLRIDEDIHKKIRLQAFNENRSINNLINTILRKYLEEKEKDTN